jgi:hypothetical protein
MATFTKKLLSGSTSGKAVLVAATASAGTTVHTGSASSSIMHEVWLYAINQDTGSRVLTIQWGGTTAGTDDMKITIPSSSGLYVVVPGLILQGNSTPLVVRAYADITNKITIVGFVNEIS